tara:strand:+ start:287 stop:472 length:186 start_codon:yes stop_codon:yes gene_type:complete
MAFYLKKPLTEEQRMAKIKIDQLAEGILSMMKAANLEPDHWQDLQSTVDKKIYAKTKTVWK